jgi:transposase
VLRATGQIDALLASCARFAEHTAVLDAHRQGRVPTVQTIRIGPALVFERLWRQSGFPEILGRLLAERQFQFPVERAVFLTVLHRLFAAGSDRAAEVWRCGYDIQGVSKLQLQHLYRAMAWLGEPLADDQQAYATPFAPRCTKDLIEEALFQKRRDLFSALDLVFFDTTSIYFEGRGGQQLGRRGHSKDHRPDCPQMVVGAVLDAAGRALCSELWPGHTSDVTTLVPLVDRLKHRFQIGGLCVVADRGMISKKTLAELRAAHRDTRYILGARLRAVKEIRERVLSDGGAFQQVHGPQRHTQDPSPLQVKEVRIDTRRYIVCRNEDQARKDECDRQAIVTGLRDQLKRGDKSLVGNRGYRKFLKATPERRFEVDEEKVLADARFDGIWVLQTDLDIEPAQVALRYKELWRVEAVFRLVKSVLETRPIYHKRDETIRGHVFCSFLALVLLKELQARIAEHGWEVEWERLKNDLEALEEITVENAAQTFVLRSQTRGDAGKALQAAGVALRPSVRLLPKAKGDA